MVHDIRTYCSAWLLSFLFLAGTAQATPIVSVVGPLEGGYYPISLNEAAAASSWYQPATYTDVSISALLTFGPAGGTAYLMTQIGPGTTTASEVARSNFAFNDAGTVQNVTLFAGLTLPPATYYLVLGSNAAFGSGWRDAYSCGNPCSFDPPVIQLGDGVTRFPDYLSASTASVAAYVPASTFTQGRGINGDPYLQYTVDSTPTPEPPTLVLCISGLVLLVVTGWQRERRLRRFTT